ncbi:hypothetical protein SDC9_138779 [bioreactor metagenome]|uniref:Uncharacterized protein n=1 Tax=bioreactor metagenome TaxID=1076179 RepID=A0A645DR88_9ZZZZ
MAINLLFDDFCALGNIAVAFPHFLAQRVYFAFAEEVHFTQLPGVHIQLARQHIHHAFGSELAFLVAIATVSAYSRCVGVNGITNEVTVCELVRTRAVMRRGNRNVDRSISIGAARMDDLGLDGDQLAIFFGADLHLRADAMSDEGGGEIFFAGGHPLDRSARYKTGDPGHGLFHGDIRFVAKTAADIGDVHAHI